MAEAEEDYPEKLRQLRHDINNQLSNVQLSLEQLKYEVAEQTEDYIFYIQTIETSCQRINELLENTR